MINWCPCALSHIPGVHVERAVDGSHVPHSNEYHVHYSPHSQAPEAEQFPNALLPHPQVEPVHSKPSQCHTETHNTPTTNNNHIANKIVFLKIIFYTYCNDFLVKNFSNKDESMNNTSLLLTDWI